jgi:hypothetical protein
VTDTPAAAYVRAHVLPPAFSLLPASMDSREARAEVFACGWQESRFAARQQIGGPAKGLWQFEAHGGVKGVLTHEATRGLVTVVWKRLGYVGYPTEYAAYVAIEHNDVLACCFARLLLWTLPQPMPPQGDGDAGYAAYLAAWRPGKPKPETWPDAWARAWQTS